MASSNDESEESLDLRDGWDDCVVVQGKPLTTKCDLLVKGGDVDDDGQPIEMSVDNRFHSVFYEYAKKVGVRPKDLRLFLRGQLISPEDTPFEIGMYRHELVLAYDKTGKPLPVEPPQNVPTSTQRHICICTVAGGRESNRFVMRNETRIKDLYMKWGVKHNVDEQRVRLWYNGEDLNDQKTVAEEGLVDGVVVWAHIEPRGFKRRDNIAFNEAYYNK